MKSITITLGDRTYTVQSLKFKAEREWRKKYDAPISNLITAVSTVKHLSTKQYEQTGELFKEIGMVLLSHADELLSALLNSPDTCFEAICDYSPAIAADRAFVEENAYQEEIARAFIEVVKLAYPFGSLLGIATSLGSLEKQTTQSSPSLSGDSGKTS
jgi:hypothetical protein